MSSSYGSSKKLGLTGKSGVGQDIDLFFRGFIDNFVKNFFDSVHISILNSFRNRHKFDVLSGDQGISFGVVINFFNYFIFN